jgi:predicted PurR-regulated permease PerM
MEDRTLERIDQIAALAAIALLIIGCLFILRPFVSALLWAVILSYSTWPLFARLLGWLNGRQVLAATLMAIVVAALMVAPLVVISTSLAEDVANLVSAGKRLVSQGPPPPPAWLEGVPVVGDQLLTWWQEWMTDSRQFLSEFQDVLAEAGKWLLGHGLALAEGVLQLSLSVLVLFFLYRDGSELVERLTTGMTRIAGSRASGLLAITGGTIKGVVYGIFGTALAQGILAGVGFFIAGVPAALLLGMITFFLSVVPMGPPLVWIPASIWLYYQGSGGWALFTAVWGFFVISSVDNFLKPYLISRGGALPFVLVLLGVLGGVITFGFIGVFLGPTLLAVAYSLMRDWTRVASGTVAADAEAQVSSK